MSSVTKMLDSMLPLLEPQQAELHINATIIEVAEPTQLVELAVEGKIRRFLLGRLSDTVALVEPGCATLLEDALLAGGHMPKIA